MTMVLGGVVFYSNSLNTSVAWYWRALFIVVCRCWDVKVSALTTLVIMSLLGV
jgi:hypothetical protein